MTKQYFQPQVQVVSIALQSIILAGSGEEPAASGPTVSVKTNPTTEVW
jgi:hypothetical protein